MLSRKPPVWAEKHVIWLFAGSSACGPHTNSRWQWWRKRSLGLRHMTAAHLLPVPECFWPRLWSALRDTFQLQSAVWAAESAECRVTRCLWHHMSVGLQRFALFPFARHVMSLHLNCIISHIAALPGKFLPWKQCVCVYDLKHTCS